ncbi:MAG: ATP-binding protein [Burkholderiaceae bacterium]|nr:ATP-binding protein [Burkholderiaceae bacterium]
MSPASATTSRDRERLDNERLRRELQQARAALEDFTYSVSHDLRASLRHVNAYLQIIKEDFGDLASPDILAHLDTVSQSAGQMGQQIDALTELSRLARVELQLSSLDVGQLVRDVSTAVAPQPSERELAWELASDFPPLRGDADLIRQVLTHLLSNAVKFTAPRPAARITVGWQAHDSGLYAVTVSDNGVGFNPQYAAKLFNAFQRLHRVREFAGLGMGLALTRKIVERHGGAVWAEGVPDVGCSVSFTLPRAA